MTCLSGLTASRNQRSGRWALCALALSLSAAGCGQAGHVAPLKTVRGYADLDILVRHHPGWVGVARYDLALTRLRNASVRVSDLQGDPSLAVLEAPDAPLPQIAPGVAQGERLQLEAVRRTQIARLRARRAQARQAQVALLQDAWRQQADTDYALAARRAQGAYLRQVRRAAGDREARRLNLSLQIKALTDTLAAWKTSPPPAPRLRQAQAALAQRQTELAALESARALELRTAGAARSQALAQAQAARLAFVQAQTHQKLAALEAQDSGQVAAFEARLAKQEQALLAAQAAQAPVLVAPAGSLSAEALPPAPHAPALLPGSAARSEAQLQSAQTHLLAQRARWIAFLYDDTRAAALDAAQQQHWIVTFGRTGPGVPLTGPLAQILATRIWKT